MGFRIWLLFGDWILVIGTFNFSYKKLNISQINLDEMAEKGGKRRNEKNKKLKKSDIFAIFFAMLFIAGIIWIESYVAGIPRNYIIGIIIFVEIILIIVFFYYIFKN